MAEAERYTLCECETDLWREGIDPNTRPPPACMLAQHDETMATMSPTVLREDDFMMAHERNHFASCMELPSAFSLVTFVIPKRNDEGYDRSVCFVKTSEYGMQVFHFAAEFDPIKTMPRGSTGKGMFYKTDEGALHFGVYDVEVLGAHTTQPDGDKIRIERMDFSDGVCPFERVFALSQAWKADRGNLVHIKYSGWANCHVQAVRRRSTKQGIRGTATFAVLGKTPQCTLERFSATV